MAKLTQYSRISHHTIYGATGSTFSVPSSEDFTDGTWTMYDLALSEIGVNETDYKAYMRVNDEIREFAWVKSETSGATNSIIMTDTSGSLYNSNIVIKQIAVTVSQAEVSQLYTTPKILVSRTGTSTVHQVISAYVKVQTPGAMTGNTNLVLYEGGNGVTHECNALGTANVRRYRFIPRNTSSSLVQTQDDDNDITLSTDTGNPSGGSTASLVVYLTYTTYNENNILY